MTNKVVGYGVSLLMLFAAFYVASRAWKAGQSSSSAASATEGKKMSKEKVGGYIVSLVMLGVAIWVVSSAWKSGQTPAAAN
jgi:uncharacterized membrane protein